MTIKAQFDGFTLREPSPSDRIELEEWIAKDPAHFGVFGPEHFLGTEDPRGTVMVLEDEDGTVMFIRIARVARVDIQFSPDVATGRTRTALIHGMAAIEAMLSQAGTEEWIFQTASRGLRLAAKRDLGFRDSEGEMVRSIEPPQKGMVH